MTRTSWWLAGLLTISCASLFGYLHATNSDAATRSLVYSAGTEPKNTPGVVAATSVATANTTGSDTAVGDPAAPHVVTLETAPEKINEWISAATSDDLAARAAAIKSLATVPEAQAVPVLQKVLSDGVDGDRQLALNSLQTLALNQGDADGAIREVLRLAIYDGGDAAVESNAQVLLDDIEHDANRDQKAP